MKREARERDASQREHYEGQMRSEGLDPATGASTTSSTSSSRSSTPAPFFVPAPIHSAVTSSGGGTVAGAMLGALLFFTARAYIQGGFSGVKAFYAAKFLNRTSAAPNPVPVSATTQTTLPVNNAAGGSAASSTPSTSSGSAKGAGQVPAGNQSGGTLLKAGLS
jgi:hypothetical protein